MYDELDKTVDRFNNWFMTKILNALWALFWGMVGFCIVQGGRALFELSKLLFRAACSFTRQLIRAFEERTGFYITHSLFLTGLAWILVWVLVILPLGAVFLVGLGAIVGIVEMAIPEGYSFLPPLMAGASLAIGVTIALIMGAGSSGSVPEGLWDNSSAFSRGNFDEGLRLGEEGWWD